MATLYKPLTVYAIRETLAGVDVTNFNQVLNPDKEVVEYGPVDLEDFSAKLFIMSSGPRRPPWASFLETGFGEIEEIFANDSFSALMIVRIKYNKDIYFAFSFGHGGRFLIKV